MKLSEIARGWVNFVTASESVKKEAERRLAICDGCPNKKQLNSLGKVIVSTINSEANLFYCAGCGCPLAAKSVSPQSVCPLGKW